MNFLMEKNFVSNKLFFNLKKIFALQAQVQSKLSDLNMTNPTGYAVENLWTGEYLGILKPSDEFQFEVNATGIFMLKATVIPASKKEILERNQVLYDWE